ncbi:MAG TPA: BREX-1 system adenine-specific DNA-methyltransferase PglX [Erysipelotrichaceae bacterium]|nr:BREX-1 system adenine-specific DNA-methyltransferase PglX [Erysipelotrichaceae bacterium]
MNKTAIKNYAVWARNELKELVTQRAYEYEVTADSVPSYNTVSVHGRLLSEEEKKQLNELIKEVKKNGFDHVVEEVAYTWFNRFIALRYMEVNNYLPQRVRVFTNENNEFKPELLTEAIHIELDGLDKQKVFDYIEQNNQEELYKYLLLTICNDMNQYLPDMFTSISDYKTLLMPNNLLKEDGVLAKLISDIDEDSWNDQVQIIGWLYQFYNTENMELVYSGSMSKGRIIKDLLPAATTIYTPDWVARYMVENSLGKIWIEGHSSFNHGNWKYYLEEAEQETEVVEKLNKIKEERSKMKPEDLKVIDPCMGSGHILVYAFDALIDIYRDQGYSDRAAARLILENNLYGLEIDERAYHLAYFALMMKARSYNRRILSKDTKVNVFEIRESSGELKPEYDPYLENYKDLTQYLINEFKEAKELGSIVNLSCSEEQLDELEEHINNLKSNSLDADLIAQTEIEEIYDLLMPLIKQARLLVQKYDSVVTNPPYLNSSRFSNYLNNYVIKHYKEVKSDLCMVMYKKWLFNLKSNGLMAFLTPTSWMFLSSFEKWRKDLLHSFDIDTLVDFGSELFEGKVGHNLIVAWVTRNSKFHKKGSYIRLVDYCYSRRDEKKNEFFDSSNLYISSSENFSKIPGSPIAYWVGYKTIKVFSNAKLLGNLIPVKKGMDTGNNDYYIKLWYEINFKTLDLFNHSFKWIPYDKGGIFRKWYGNNDYILNWENDGYDLKHSKANLRSKHLYFKKSITWNALSSANTCFRASIFNGSFDSAGSSMFPMHEFNFYLGLMNSVTTQYFLNIINPTLNYGAGSIANIPIIFHEGKKILVNNIVCNSIEISKADWDSFETSWDFTVHPLVKNHVSTISEAYSLWDKECNDRFNQLKTNEEELNRIFIDIYGLQDELDPYVEDKDVTVRKADLVRDIKSFISYAVGCMFGRYSLDKAGLVFAGGNFDDVYWKHQGFTGYDRNGHLPLGSGYAGISLAKVHYPLLRDNEDVTKATKLSYEPDVDDIIPICDEEYFEDDIVSRFVEFVRCVYGEDTLEENLRFIADALGGKGNPREVLRNYFLNDFFKDHCNTYQVTGSGKRPIYWLFDSGKKNGFKALVYIHRYTPDLIARMRTGYIHPLQSQYRTQIEMLNNQIDEAVSTSEKVKLQKQLKKINEQLTELSKYEEIVHHWADKMEPMDLDDGVKANYAKFQELLAKIK